MKECHGTQSKLTLNSCHTDSHYVAPICESCLPVAPESDIPNRRNREGTHGSNGAEASTEQTERLVISVTNAQAHATERLHTHFNNAENVYARLGMHTNYSTVP